jgi:hypothetical protein
MRVESSILSGVGCFCGMIWLSLRLIEAHGLDSRSHAVLNFLCWMTFKFI